jgi:hypothetical protein
MGKIRNEYRSLVRRPQEREREREREWGEYLKVYDRGMLNGFILLRSGTNSGLVGS